VLRDVSGAALPVDISNTSTNWLLIADTIRFDGAGAATGTTVTQQQLSGQQPTTTRSNIDLWYTVEGDAIKIGLRCPPNANCTGPASGHLVSRDVFTMLHGTRVYLYVRR